MKELIDILDGLSAVHDPRAEAEHFCEVLADAMVSRRDLDEELLEARVVEACDALGSRVDGDKLEKTLAAFKIAGACLDFRQHRRVALADGRVACEGGWICGPGEGL